MHAIRCIQFSQRKSLLIIPSSSRAIVGIVKADRARHEGPACAFFHLPKPLLILRRNPPGGSSARFLPFLYLLHRWHRRQGQRWRKYRHCHNAPGCSEEESLSFWWDWTSVAALLGGEPNVPHAGWSGYVQAQVLHSWYVPLSEVLLMLVPWFRVV